MALTDTFVRNVKSQKPTGQTLTVAVRGNYVAIIDPKPAGDLMRAIYGYHGHPYAAAALKLFALLFVRPGELRAAERREIDLDDAIWRIPGVKMKMRHDHLVPLSAQAVEIFRGLQRITRDWKYVSPASARTIGA
jgi:integrase